MSLSEARKAVTDEMVKTKRFIRHEINSIINGVVNDTAMAFAAVNRWTIVLPGRKQSKKRNGISPNEWQENHPNEYKALLRRALFPGENKYALDIYDGLFAIGKPGVKLPEDGRMNFIITHASSEGDSLNDVQLRATVIQN